MVATPDVWERGASYEPYIGRWSRLVASVFVEWLQVPPRRRWVEVGCGTGALTETILTLARPESVHAVDASEGYVTFARRAIADDRVRFEVADARRLPYQDSTSDAAVSGLVLNFVPEPERMVLEMARTVRAGGIVAAYVWDYAGEMQIIRRFWNSAVALDPAATELDEGRRFPICHPDRLAELWSGVGLQGVEVRAIDVPTRFRDFDDYWGPFLGGQGPAPTYAASLDEARRIALREAIRTTMPDSRDGGIELLARAWAVRGTVDF